MAGLWLLASAIYLCATYPAFSPDSYAYVAAAQSFMESGHFTLPFAPTASDSLPVPLSAWPPGYPLLIAFTSMAGTDPWLAGRLVAGLCTLLALLFAWVRLRRHGGSVAISLAATSAMTATVATTIWSEGAFILALCLLAAGLVCFRQSEGRSRGALVWVSASLCAALLLRHAGWFLVPAVLFLLWKAGGSRWPMAGLSLCALLPAALFLSASRTFGAWESGWDFQATSLLRAFAETAAAVGRTAVVPWSESLAIQAAAGSLPALWLVLGGRPRGPRIKHPLAGVAYFLGLSLLAGTWTVRVIEPSFVISDRLIWPAWMLLATAALLQLESLHRRPRILVLIVGAIVVTQTAGVLTLPTRDIRRADSNHSFQVGGQLTPDQVVISNEAWRAWKLFGSPGYYLPRSRAGRESFNPDSLGSWAARRNVTRLVWFADGLSPAASVLRFGPLGDPDRGNTIPSLRLVGQGDTYHTYDIGPAEP